MSFMVKETLLELYERDLRRLDDEVGQYLNESELWIKRGTIANSAGNLCLHILGNLDHFIGAVLGNSGYVRDRESEFSATGVSRENLRAAISATAATVSRTLKGLDDENFQITYPIEVFGGPMTTGFFLIHLATHLNYHLGQINYHRRLVSET
ncbi:MAG: DinB family protein [Pyrinomonadaceae bacterium]